jgi:Na+/phosphate symporter
VVPASPAPSAASLIGLGLILLALHILLDTLVPAEQAPAVRALLASITNDPVLCIVIAAALTWAAHSSVAVVLLVMSLVYSQFVTRESLQAAFGIFMTGDVEAARKLLSEKSELRKAEIEAADRHFERLREGRPESLETTSLHLDVLADLKRIHSHICSVAYPVLEAAGELPALDAAKNDTAAAAAAAFQPKLP